MNVENKVSAIKSLDWVDSFQNRYCTIKILVQNNVLISNCINNYF
jgi:hypothetical protein